MSVANVAVDSLAWLRANRAAPGGVVVTSRRPRPYPEVTGYWIPTLLREGETGIALDFARWLLSAQRPDGSFADPEGVESYAFDTGQVVRGLVAILDHLPEAEDAMRRACDWLVGSAEASGRLRVPESPDAWDMGRRGRVSEGNHLYVLPGLAAAAERLDEPRWARFVRRSRDWYLANVPVLDAARPEMITHFFCYIQEALFDLGATDEAARGMRQLAERQRDSGALPAYADCSWICSPGTFQAAIVWDKLGDRERARRTVEFMEGFVNASGGFYGSYGPEADYFPAEEPSWASKFHLDARARIEGREDTTVPVAGAVAASRAERPRRDRDAAKSAVRAGNPRAPRRLVVVPSDPLRAYVDAGYPDLTGYFNPEGWFDEVYALAWHETEEHELYGVKVIPTRPEDFARRVRELGAHCIRAYDLPAGRYAGRELVPGVPLIVSVHDTDVRRFEPGLPPADLFLAVSGAVEDRLREFGARGERIQRLPNRVDLDVFRPIDDEEGRRAFAQRFPGRHRILHVGRKTEQKNIETVLRALAAAGEGHVGIFVGRGDDGPYRALAAELGISDRCHWVESVPNAELAAWYSFADCLCVPSLWEGFGIVFIEAMACGAPVLTSDIRPMNEFIEDGRSGLLLRDPHDAEELAARIRLVCASAPVRERLAVGARRAAARFDRRRIDREESDHYREAVERRAARPPIAVVGPRPLEVVPVSLSDSPLEIARLRREDEEDWTSVVETSPDAFFFHSWRAQLLNEEAWPSETLSFVVRQDGRPLAVCPLQRWRDRPEIGWSNIMGPGGPALRGDLAPADREALLGAIDRVLDGFLAPGGLEELKLILPPTAPSSRLCWRTGENPLAARGFTDGSTLTSVVPLGRELEAIWRDLHPSYRRDIRRARKNGLEASRAEATAADLDAYYALHVETYRRTGVTPHPRAYFEGIFRHFVASGATRIWFARREGRVIGAANVAEWGDSSLYWTGAYSAEGLEHEAAKLLQWTAIESLHARGILYHETGEVFPEADPASKEAGLTLFKRRFGGNLVPFFRGSRRRPSEPDRG
ncbi:MAG: GNAT family N-acetyltransferase [Planctomycetota bacterium]